RVEVIFPVKDPEIRKHLRNDVLPRYLADNVNTWTLGSDGTWSRVENRSERRRDVHREMNRFYARKSVVGEAVRRSTADSRPAEEQERHA
ncbi:MAG: hypothetical protein AB7V46_10555, partial [Thermomicrobiales bacterium]